MRVTSKSVLLAAAIVGLVGCNPHNEAAQEQNQDISVGLPMTNETMANADIETLPPDESSATPSNQLESGSDNPDVNDLDVSANSE